MVLLRRNTSQRTDREGQAVDHQGEIYRRKGKTDRRVVEEVADHLGDKEGLLQDHEDTVNLQGGRADHQDVVVALQEGGVSLQDGVVGPGHHVEDAIVINTRVVTLKDKHTKGTRTMSKYAIC